MPSWVPHLRHFLIYQHLSINFLESLEDTMHDEYEAALERIRAAGAAAADKASLDPNYLIDKAIEDMEERL